MTAAEREAFDSMLKHLMAVRTLAALEARMGQENWQDCLVDLDAVIAQAQKSVHQDAI